MFKETNAVDYKVNLGDSSIQYFGGQLTYKTTLYTWGTLADYVSRENVLEKCSIEVSRRKKRKKT